MTVKIARYFILCKSQIHHKNICFKMVIYIYLLINTVIYILKNSVWIITIFAKEMLGILKGDMN